jgi:hypothetical protein
MFELSDNIIIQTEVFCDSIIYTIENFYKNPDEVVEHFWKYNPQLWKQNQSPSNNGIYFEDRRHMILHKDIEHVYYFLETICKQQPLNLNYNMLCSNATKFYKNKFNDYGNNYWWPHTDSGYTGIVYFNRHDYYSGTNLYEIINHKEEPPNYPEHYQPWRNKNNFKLLKKISPEYNKFVFFDGLKFTHGMNICDGKYFSHEYRFNQVFFYKDLNYNYDY